MPTRSQARVRRDINRLNDLVVQHGPEQPALAAVGPVVAAATEDMNIRWRAYQAASVAADRERGERDSALGRALGWIQRWRPVVLMLVPAAAENLSKLPASGATADDTLRVAQDLLSFINERQSMEAYRQAAVDDLGDGLTVAQRELAEASAAGPAEAAAREAFSAASLHANEILVRGSQIVRAIFGATAPEYKQLVVRHAAEDDEDDSDLDPEPSKPN